MDYILVDNDEVYNQFKSVNAFNSPNITISKDYATIMTENDYLLFHSNCKVLIYGRSVYDFLVGLNKANKIHFGLRSFDYGTIKKLSHLTIGKCKIIVCNHFLADLKSKLNVDKYKYFLQLPSDYVPDCQLKEMHIVTCDDGMEYLNRFGLDEELGFDFESKSFPDLWDFEPVGIGVANRDVGVYVDFRYYSSEEVRKKFFEDFRIWVRNHQTHLWVYYCNFEFNALRRMYHEFFKICDCMTLLKCYNDGGNLKSNAQNWLHVTSWDDDQDILNERAAGVFAKFKTYDDFIDSINHPEKYDEQALVHRDKMLKMIEENGYTHDILKRYWGYEFAATPKPIIGKYCILDAFYTLMISMTIENKYHYIGTR